MKNVFLWILAALAMILLGFFADGIFSKTCFVFLIGYSIAAASHALNDTGICRGIPFWNFRI